MNQQVTLTVSDNVWFYAKSVAAQNKRRIEDVMSDWLDKMSSEVEVEKLSDAKILALANLQLPESQQETLHELLEKNSLRLKILLPSRRFPTNFQISFHPLRRRMIFAQNLHQNPHRFLKHRQRFNIFAF